MKIILLFMILICTHSFLYAQDAVIAVGKAEQDKDKLVIDDSEIENLSEDRKRLATEALEILRNDFNFYKHRFGLMEYSEKGKSSYSNPNMEKWENGGISFFVASKIENGAGTSIEASFKVWSISSKDEIFSGKFTISKEKLRADVHRLADALYKSITGKSSIFNSKIVFVSDRTSRKQIEKELYIMDFDGRRVEKLTNFNSVVLSPSVSHDNSKILFSQITQKREILKSKIRFIKNIDLKMLDLKTGKFSTISDKPGINSGAIFSSDNEVIYLTLSFGGNADIYEMKLSNGKMRKVTSHYADDVDASITKNGEMMSFLSNRSGRAQIYTMDPSSTEKGVKRISFVGQFNATPRFSPDGKEIVFTSWVDDGFDLYKIGSDGNNLVRLTKNFGSNEEPSFSPDGEFIIFSSKRMVTRRKATQDIYIMNREGEILGQLTQNFGHCLSAQWSK